MRFPWHLLVALVLSYSAPAAEPFRVATYNLQNYIATPNGSRPAKTEASRAKIRESISAGRPDVIALQEVGGVAELAELQAGLRANGIDLQHSELVRGWDTNIHLAVLSRFPIKARRPHTNDAFAWFGKQHLVRRGFLEVDIEVNAHFTFTLITAHLKSKLSDFEADESALREQEAILLRKHVDAVLNARPDANLIVLGDFNDTQDSKTVRTIIGRRNALVDTRPAEPNGDDAPNTNAGYAPPRITWTHYFAREDSFTRIDYILISRNMAKVWLPDKTEIVRLPNWGLASDHRPVVAAFEYADR